MPARKTAHKVTVTRVMEQNPNPKYDTERILIQCSTCGEIRNGGDLMEEEIEREILSHRLEVLEKRAGIEFFRMADEPRVDPD